MYHPATRLLTLLELLQAEGALRTKAVAYARGSVDHDFPA